MVLKDMITAWIGTKKFWAILIVLILFVLVLTGQIDPAVLLNWIDKN